MLIGGVACTAAEAVVVAPQTTVLGPTPEIRGCNAGHLYPGGNTIDWWRYSGANGARVFISPSDIEPSDDLSPVGDGVFDEASFLRRRDALRADPLSTRYIQWSVFEGNFANRDLHPVNHLKTDAALAELTASGIEACAQITAGAGRFPLTGADDWPGLWELWQHYYAHAFHLARHHGVRRFQMYNEPDAVPVAEADYLLRLRVCSDAIQGAVADVNRLYGKALIARVHAPVNAGNATSDFNGGLGGAAVAQRHLGVTGVADATRPNLHVYDYHQYDGSPSGYASSLAGLHTLLDSAMAPQPRLPTCISEFNVHTGANFDAIPETLDSPAKFARLGAILTRLAAGGIAEMYLFKFSQTLRSGGNYPVAKNAMHYVDNTNAPYAVGGITQGGEVWRLFNKASGTGYRRLGVVKDTAATALEVQATWNPDTGERHLYCVNTATSGLPLTLDFSPWGTEPGAPVRIEEVGEACRGAVAAWTQVDAARRVEGVIGPSTAWLVSLPGTTACTEQVVVAAADATVRDGSRVLENAGGATVLEARNDPTANSPRAAALLRFELPVLHPPDVLAVTLAAEVSTTATSPCQAHVHAIDDDTWVEGTVTWSRVPNLRQNLAAGSRIRHAAILGSGTSAHLQGQWQANPGPAATLRLDVTRAYRAQIDRALSFLIVQDPRWDVALPSLEPGDTQPGGLTVASREGSSAPTRQPRLHILRKTDTDGDGIGDSAETREFGTDPLLADTDGDGVSDGIEILVNRTEARQTVAVPAKSEATVRGGTYAADDIAETSYLMVKHSSDLGFCRKSYFQFDLSGSPVDRDGPATLWLRFTQSYAQRVALWAVVAPDAAIAPSLTWNTAPGNDPLSNAMLTSAALPIGGSMLVEPGSDSPRPPVAFRIPRLGDYLVGTQLTLALCPEPDPANHSGGLRIEPASASLHCRPSPPAETTPLAIWKQAAFGGDWNNPAIAADEADPDRDGRCNLLEYALGGDPLAAASLGDGPRLSTTSAPPVLTLSLDPSRSDLSVAVQRAASPEGPWIDLATTDPAIGLVALEPGVTIIPKAAAARTTYEVQLAPSTSATRRFLRLRVTRLP